MAGCYKAGAASYSTFDLDSETASGAAWPSGLAAWTGKLWDGWVTLAWLAADMTNGPNALQFVASLVHASNNDAGATLTALFAHASECQHHLPDHIMKNGQETAAGSCCSSVPQREGLV